MRRMFALAFLSVALAYNAPAHAAEMQCLPALDGIERVMQMTQLTQGRITVLDTEASTAFIRYIRTQLPLFEIGGTDVLLIESQNGFTAAFVLNVASRQLCAMAEVEPHHMQAAKEYASGLKA